MAKRARAKKVGWVFAAIWTAIVLPIDGFMGYGLWRQMGTSDYTPTDGRITHSEVIVDNSGDDGPTYRAAIAFTYTVDGRAYESDSYRFGAFGSSSRSLAREAVARYPVGKKVTAFYDPVDPSSAVLETSIRGVDLFLPLFLWPFNVVMIGLWVAVVAMRGPRSGSDSVGGYRLTESGIETRLKLGSQSPLFAAGIASGGFAFVAIFPIAFLLDLAPSIQIMQVVWAGVFGSGLLAFLLTSCRGLSGGQSLVIDHARGVVRLPSTKLFPDRLEVRPDLLKTVDLRFSKSGVQVNGKTARELIVTYENEQGERVERPIAYRFDNPERLDDVALWLAETFGLELGGEEKSQEAASTTKEPPSEGNGLDMTMEA